MRTAIYTRVSTDEQAKEGYSLEDQKTRLLNHCIKMNWNVVDFYSDEGISGSSIIGRPEASRMLVDAKKRKYDNLLVLKTDRLSRKLKDLLEIQEILVENKIKLTILEEPIDTENDTGFAMYAMSGTFAQLERNRIKARTIAGRKQKANNGIKSLTGKILFGYEYKDGQYIPKEPEASVIRDIFNKYDSGMSLRAISKIIINNDYLPGYWSFSRINNIIKNPTYKGYAFYSLYSHNKENDSKDLVLAKATNITPIIDEELFDKINARKELNKANNVRKHSKEDFIFADVVYCGYCKSRLYCQNAKGYKEGTRRCYYRCCSAQDFYIKCEFTSIENTTLEMLFINYFKDTKINLIDDGTNITNKQINELESTIRTIKANIKKISQRKESLTEKFIDNTISKDDYLEYSKSYSDNLLKLNEQIDDTENTIQILNSKKNEAIDLNETIAKIQTILNTAWHLMNNHDKREFVNGCINKIYLVRKEIQAIDLK